MQDKTRKRYRRVFVHGKDIEKEEVDEYIVRFIGNKNTARQYKKKEHKHLRRGGGGREAPPPPPHFPKLVGLIRAKLSQVFKFSLDGCHIHLNRYCIC